MWSRRGLLLAIAIACGPSHPAARQTPASMPAGRLAELRAQAPGAEVRDEVLAIADRPPLALRFVLKPETAANAPRLMDATKSALRRLDEWLGPLPGSSLEVIDLEWRSPFAGASYPGVIVTSARVFQPARDRTLERGVIAALARQYWQVPAGSSPASRWLGEGLALYTGVRAIHEELEGRHFATERHFGGFVPFTTRSIQWSPSPEDPRPRMRHFAEVDTPAEAPWRFWSAAARSEAQRVALALHTLERYIGWPATQQVLQAFQQRWQEGPATPNDLAALVTAQQGREMQWFFDEALRFDAGFDYRVQSFDGEPTATGYRTSISLRRDGDGVFGATDAALAIGQARSLRVETRFEDGTLVDDWWDGRQPELALTYEGPSRAVATSVDPEAMLLLDSDRSNNARAAAPALTETGARLIASWLVWLQDITLTSTALL